MAEGNKNWGLWAFGLPGSGSPSLPPSTCAGQEGSAPSQRFINGSCAPAPVAVCLSCSLGRRSAAQSPGPRPRGHCVAPLHGSARWVDREPGRDRFSPEPVAEVLWPAPSPRAVSALWFTAPSWSCRTVKICLSHRRCREGSQGDWQGKLESCLPSLFSFGSRLVRSPRSTPVSLIQPQSRREIPGFTAAWLELTLSSEEKGNPGSETTIFRATPF